MNYLICLFLFSERKMKPLLPRTDSYLVPIQLPLTPSLFLHSPAAALSLSTPQQSTAAPNPVSRTGCKRLCIAPKVNSAHIETDNKPKNRNSAIMF